MGGPAYNLSHRPYAPVTEGPARRAVEDCGMAAFVASCDDMEASTTAVIEEYMPESYPVITLMSEWLSIPVSVN